MAGARSEAEGCSVWYIEICPLSGECSARSWKKSKVRSYTGEEHCRELLMAHLTKSSLHGKRSVGDLERIVREARVVRSDFTAEELAEWTRTQGGTDDDVRSVATSSVTLAERRRSRSSHRREAPRSTGDRGDRREQQRGDRGGRGTLRRSPSRNRPSPPRVNLRLRTPDRRGPGTAVVSVSASSSAAAIVPAVELVPLPAATLHAVHTCLEQAAMALGHAQNLCSEAQRAFGEEQTHVRLAMSSIRDALRNAGYFL